MPKLVNPESLALYERTVCFCPHVSRVTRVFLLIIVLKVLALLAFAEEEVCNDFRADCLHANVVVDPWQWTGEWGMFTYVRRTGDVSAHEEGAGLSISDCSDQQCQASFEIIGPTFHGEAKADLQIKSDTEAIAHLRAGLQEKCTLALAKTSKNQRSITASLRSGDCSYFETSGASFEHTYPLRAKALFYADDIPACFVGGSPSVVALCASQALSQQEHNWVTLLREVSGLGQPSLDKSAEEAKILGSCDAAVDAEACLSTAFYRSTQDLVARRDAWKASITDPGNPDEAQRTIKAIQGSYRHSFANGDVQGDKFKSTDTLRISLASATSIYVDVHLEFYNGHECNHNGVASYRRAGVFAEQLTDNQGKLCVFEVIPTPTGVGLADPTGICRKNDCGARGGYNGAAFSSSEKVNAPTVVGRSPATR
ncbi:MAG: hypothetical protein JO356_04410 [Acidobacteria bacterium]|nr:hypothetical protein [Acidobacteriota bacterium]